MGGRLHDDGSALLDCPYWRRGGRRFRLLRYRTVAARHFGGSTRAARCAERLDRINHSGAYQGLLLDRPHPQLLLAVDNRTRFEQDRGHARVSEHEQLIVAIDTGLRVDQQPLAVAHVPIRVVRRVLQSALLQLAAEHSRKQQTAGKVAVVVGDENGMAAEAVAEAALHALEFPFFQELVGDGIVMDRQEKIGAESIGALDALRQCLAVTDLR